MTESKTATKRPADHKKTKEELEYFSFEHRGDTYTMVGSLKVLSKPGFIRKNRNKDEIDVLFTLLEEIAGDDALEAIDDMEPDEFEQFAKELNEAIEEYQGATLGES